MQIVYDADSVVFNGVLAILGRVIDDLVLEHVEVENHDDAEDAVVEPFAGNLDFAQRGQMAQDLRGRNKIADEETFH